MTKDQLRLKSKEKRAGINAKQKDRLEDLMLIQFQKLAIDIPPVIMTYAPIERLHEYDPILTERFCLFRNPFITFAFPLITAGNLMQAIAVKEDTIFEKNDFGIDEPINGVPLDTGEIDMIFVPLLAFDELGHRVGYGKGYYDKFLKMCKPGVLKIGFHFFEAEKAIDDINEYDMPLNICITPFKTYTFIK